MPKLSLGLGVQNMRKIGGGGTPTIWKVAIFGAGTTTSDGEYVWDGVTFEEGKPVYTFQDFSIRFSIDYWYIYNGSTDTYYYRSIDLITWTIENGASPVPTSALSYSQSSYIQTVVLAGGTPDQSGTYTWNGTTFINGKPKYFGPLKTGAPENNYIYYSSGDLTYYLYGWHASNEEMIGLSVSADLASYWSISDALVEPTVSNIIYTS